MSRPRHGARFPAWIATTLVAAGLLSGLAACGGDDDARPDATSTTAQGTDLGGVKVYLLDHTERLKNDVTTGSPSGPGSTTSGCRPSIATRHAAS